MDRDHSIMTYAGFWRRLSAHLVDDLVFVPVMVLEVLVDGSSRTKALVSLPMVSMLKVAYDVCLIAIFGQTIGKRAAGIRVSQLDGSRVSWREAWLRSSVGIAFSILAAVGYMGLYTRLPEAHFALSWMRRSQELVAARPVWLVWTDRALQVWVWSEFLVMLSNPKRRALHDFIAGTIVVRELEAPIAEASTGNAV
jgi:uncharacterized RDD family membrane protein YckC